MDFIYNYAGFLLKTITVLIAILFIISAINSQKKKLPGELHAECINDKINHDKEKLSKKFKLKSSKEVKVKLKELPKLFVLNFNGDTRASQADQLRDEITAIISVASPKDEVMICIESPGGAVNGYGFAASQLERLRKNNIHLTACIDKVAASGGYLMACIANKILAAPFAYIGSIGVVAQLPNFHKWLKKHDIDFEQITAGEFKRTLTLFGENTKEGRKKFTEDLELIHDQFKNQVSHYRPKLNIEAVATGEHWLANDALTLGLVDELKTSDDWILEKLKDFQIIQLNKTKSQSFMEKLLKPAANLFSHIYK
jgi:serine protease SohB